MRNKYLLFTLLFFILLTIYSLNIPFFWDGTFFSETAVAFYNDPAFRDYIPPLNTDTGGFPLYQGYHAGFWRIFEKSLPVSHLITLIILLSCVYEYYKLARRFLSEQMIPFAMLLLVCEPVFVTQSILMGYDLFIAWFFLMALNAMFDQSRKLYGTALVFLCCCSIRGIMLGVSLLLIDFIINRQISAKKIFPYIPAILFTSIWALYHWKNTGWIFFSPEREDTHESFLPFSMMIRQAGFIIWKVNDIGRVALWFFLALGGIMLSKKLNGNWSLLLKILFIPLIVLSLFMIPIANPIGHKYFLVVFLCLNIAVCYLIQHHSTKKLRLVLFSVLTISLIAGNFWLYPERYGNAWDSSLKVIPYFELREKMDRFISEKGIPVNDIGTQYPLIADKRFSHLTDSSSAYTNVWMGPIANYDYFLHSNVINTDIPEQIEDMKTNWELVHEERCGQVYLALYKNPLYR